MKSFTLILSMILLLLTGATAGNAQQRAAIAENRTVSRGYFGVSMQELNRELLDRLQIKEIRGVFVLEVVKDSAAERAGVKTNDVIIRFNGQDVVDMQPLRDRIAATAPGSQVDITVVRDGKELTFQAKLGERQEVVPSPDKNLHDAAEDGNLAAAQAALAEGANVSSTGRRNDTPLHLASKRGKAKMARLLLEHGADVNSADNNGNTPLMLAAKSVMASHYGGSYAEVVELLLEKGANVHARDKDGNTALHWAVASDSELDRTAMVKLLLDKGVDVNAKGHVWTPLISASYKGHTEVVRLLLDRGADIKPQDRDGHNALHYAAEQGHKEIEQLLLAKGVEEARKLMDRGQAAVEMAQSAGDYEKAIKELDQATRLAPDQPKLYYNLALLQEKTGRYADAAESLKQYLRLSPNASDADKVQSHINRLEYKHEQDLQVRTISSIRAKVTGIRFFEGGYEGVAIGSRTFATRFARKKTRYVYWELGLESDYVVIGFEPRHFAIEAVWFDPYGQEVFRSTKKSYIQSEWKNSFHTSGYGWRDISSANWSPGTYRVDLYLDDRKIAGGEFVIQ